MKKVNLSVKGTYKDIVEYLYNNCNIVEPTEFIFTKVVNTNAKMRRLKEFKGIYQYETQGSIILNDNNHKENLFKKVCLSGFGTQYPNFEKLGID